MRKGDKQAFGEFMLDEAVKFGRVLSMPEIETWFETFTAKRVTLDDFKIAWGEHKKDPKNGVYFPNTVMVERFVRSKATETAQRDWRCAEEVNGERCGYPGAITALLGGICSAHYRLRMGKYTPDAALQIIEHSREYAPPKTAEELMERGAAQRAASGEAWRKAHPEFYVGLITKRRPADSALPASIPRPVNESPVVEEDDVNALAQMAAAEGA